MLHDQETQVYGMEFELSGGPLLLQTACSGALIEDLETDKGLHAFAIRPEREHQRLLEIARQPQNVLTLAYTPAGTIVGQVTLVPFNAWGMPDMYEIALEVSSSWRRRGIARRLLNLSLAARQIEDLIILGFGLSWHWDVAGLGITHASYRAMLIQLLAYHGFMDCPTNEANICLDPSNVLLARIGARVSVETTVQFYSDLFRAELL